ncbi:hypothetical protein [Pseudomonas mosselii]|uniref:Uncharacterized protein n=1 Tax=Pseudomonas mosselii TaxID=78327 RepID=A0A7W2JZ02_9PSED|nr:hypothetical protein [Pseudomonas mosselii]MBA6067690.1 hypothetical protein [Pseudomonas mosselii]
MTTESAQEIGVTIYGQNSTSASVLKVYRQDWFDDDFGFTIEAVSDGNPAHAQYWLKLTGYWSPRAGDYLLTAEDQGEKPHILVEFGYFEKSIKAIEAGTFELHMIDYKERSLTGRFEFPVELDDAEFDIESWEFDVAAGT